MVRIRKSKCIHKQFKRVILLILMVCTLAVQASCFTTHAIAGNYEYDSAVTCSSTDPVPVSISIDYLKTPRYKESHRDFLDSSSSERKLKSTIAELVRSYIASSPDLVFSEKAETEIRITMQLIDAGENNYQSTRSRITILMSCLTLLVLPGYTEAEEQIRISVFHQNRQIDKKRYVFYLTDYLSWLMIPFNILYTAHQPDWGVTPNDIDYEFALKDLEPAIHADLRKTLCYESGKPPAPGLSRAKEVQKKGSRSK